MLKTHQTIAGKGLEMIFNGRFAGRRAIVTGGASGIGKACADAFLARGAAVVVGDRMATVGCRPSAIMSR